MPADNESATPTLYLKYSKNQNLKLIPKNRNIIITVIYLICAQSTPALTAGADGDKVFAAVVVVGTFCIALTHCSGYVT
jgi:hypothetical protein